MSVSVKERPHVVIDFEEFADWIEQQSDVWWYVDGDPLLTSMVIFPSPSDELGHAIRKVGKDLLIFDKGADPSRFGTRFNPQNLDTMADTDNRRGERTFLCSWADGEVDWLLSEDKEASQSFD